jgi:uncharacterized repeat protein (TIGR03803 family)
MKILSCCVLLLAISSSSTFAQTLTTLHAFLGENANKDDGATPYSGLVRDSVGNMYGTTYQGGRGNQGIVFKLTPKGTYSIVYVFQGALQRDGANPYGGVLLDAKGNIFGTTVIGGEGNSGTVYRIANVGGETVLHSFMLGTDGTDPYSSLIMDANGTLYGTTYSGGGAGYGTVFRIAKDGQESILYRFTDLDFGIGPKTALAMDAQGRLYGTCPYGGELGGGFVFRLSTDFNEVDFYNFIGESNPESALILGNDGYFYGTTYSGGSDGVGTIFKLSLGAVETNLYSFTGNGTDGANPYAALVEDTEGNFYGTTYYGGTSGAGTVFKLDSTGKETILYDFTGGSDGGNPYGAVVLDASGNLYGTTTTGGESDLGTVFKLVP